MTDKIIEINEKKIKHHLGEFVRSTVEETLNSMLEAEADAMCKAQKYEHSPERQNSRAGHYDRNLHTKAGEVVLHVPKLRKATFESAIIERYKRREISVEESLIEMYLVRLSKAADHVSENIEEPLRYMDFPSEHWRKIRTNNPIERLLKEVKRRTKVIGAFPDGESAVMLSAARLRHVGSSKWSKKSISILNYCLRWKRNLHKKYSTD